MKKKYEDLYMQLCNFVEQDILTESGEPEEVLHDNWYDETNAPSGWEDFSGKDWVNGSSRFPL